MGCNYVAVKDVKFIASVVKEQILIKLTLSNQQIKNLTLKGSI